MDDLLELILDTLIPPSADGRMPGAGTLGLAAALREQTTASSDVVDAGLAAAAARDFASLDLSGRVAALREIEAEQPSFVPTLYLPACAAYYQHPAAQAGLGLEGRPPHPAGYELEPGNLDALEKVKARGKLYRDV